MLIVSPMFLLLPFTLPMKMSGRYSRWWCMLSAFACFFISVSSFSTMDTSRLEKDCMVVWLNDLYSPWSRRTTQCLLSFCALLTSMLPSCASQCTNLFLNSIVFITWARVCAIVLGSMPMSMMVAMSLIFVPSMYSMTSTLSLQYYGMYLGMVQYGQRRRSVLHLYALRSQLVKSNSSISVLVHVENTFIRSHSYSLQYCMQELIALMMYVSTKISTLLWLTRKGYCILMATFSLVTLLWPMCTWAREAAAIGYSSISYTYSSLVVLSLVERMLLMAWYSTGVTESCSLLSTSGNYGGTTPLSVPKYWPSFKYMPLFYSLRDSMARAVRQWAAERA